MALHVRLLVRNSLPGLVTLHLNSPRLITETTRGLAILVGRSFTRERLIEPRGLEAWGTGMKNDKAASPIRWDTRRLTAKARQPRTHNIVNAFNPIASQERPIFAMPPRIKLEDFRDEILAAEWFAGVARPDNY